MSQIAAGLPVFLLPVSVSNQREAAARLGAWWEKAARVYPENTKKAWRSDWKIYLGFCLERGASPCPAEPSTVAAFVDHCRLAGKKPATTRRYLSTIALAHRVAGLADPCADEFVQLEIKGLYNLVSARQKQAKALGWEAIKRFIETAGEGIQATRERALLSLAYDLLGRRSEIANLEVRDLTFLEDGTGRALIRKSKTDQAGEGAVAYLTRDTVRWVRTWLAEAKITEGAVFRRIWRGGEIGEPLSPQAISDTLRRVAVYVGYSEKEANAVSGHSIRVGATQDLLALNIDLGSVMQAGRWKSNRMPMRYGEDVLAANGGVARAALRQGRDSAGSTSSTASSPAIGDAGSVF